MYSRNKQTKSRSVLKVALWVALLAATWVISIAASAGAETVKPDGSDESGAPPAVPTVPTPIATATSGGVQPTVTPGGPPTPVGTVPAPICNPSFSDVHTTDWFYDPVRWMVCNSIALGYPDGTFRPNANTTRAQMSKMVVLAAGWPLLSPANPTFSDVLPGSTYFTVVETAYAHGLVTGYPDGTFRPNVNVSRGQLSKIVVIAKEWALSAPSSQTFTDVQPGSPFFPYVETAVDHGLIGGYPDGTFRPNSSATRAQISKIVYLAYTNP